jgi:hypothetical protein
VLAVVTAASWCFVLTRLQLGYLGGATDEYFPLGAKLRINRTLGPAAGEPSTLRPPGYPAFVAAILLVAVPAPARLSADAFRRQGQVAVMLAQGLLLALASAIVVGALAASGFDLWVATAAGLALGLNPFSLLSVGLLHYGLVHLVLLVLAIVVTERAVAEEPSLARPLVAGALWGLAALVRPVTLPIPAFLLLCLLRRRDATARRHLRTCVLVGVGMVAAVAPWTARNFRVTGRLVTVNENAWTTIWAQTAMRLPRDPNRYVWFDVYQGPFRQVFQEATGLPVYDYLAHTRQIARVEETFRRDALRRLRADPGLYARNVAGTLTSLVVGEPMILIAASRAIQAQGAETPPPGVGSVPQSWLLAGQPQPAVPALLASAVRVLMMALEGAALAGAGLWVWRPRRWGAVVLAAFLCVIAAHALVFAHLMHYYLKLPFLALFTAEALDRAAAQGEGWRRAARAAAALLAAGSAVCGLATMQLR